MHLDDAESDQLKGWIVKRLADISDADSDVLADYVLALVKSDETDDQVKQNCRDNLDDFLKEHTTAFVDDVFRTIATKSYDGALVKQGVAAASATTAPPFNPPTGPNGRRSSISNDNAAPGQSRKRTYQDWEGLEGQNGQGQQGRDRPMKQPRRGRGAFEQQRGGRQAYANAAPHVGHAMAHLPQMPTPPAGMPPFDPNNPLAALMAMQAMGMPALPGMPSLPFAPSPTAFSQKGALPPKRPGERCKDYDNKGFCALGASCPYEHGNDHVVIPATPAEEYDPTNSGLSGAGAQALRGHGERGRGRGSRGRGDRGDRGAFRGGRTGRADFSMTGPNSDHSITSIVVEQIPEDKFDEQSVRDFFSEFGNIEDVTMQPYKRLAIIKYDDYGSASKARDSPKAIFDNRFVKVYWYKPDRLPRQSDSYRNGAPSHRPAGEDVEMQEEEEKIDPVEFAKKQEEAQKAHEEKMKKIKEAEAQREELEKKVKAQAEERSKLLAKLAAKERAKSGTPDQSTHSTNGAAEGLQPPTKTTSQTEALKAKLAELEREAESMGINPNEDAQPWQGFAPRGRGGYRGRGAFVPRGAWRGRGGFAPRGGAVMRLDNRPKSVAVVFPNNEEMSPEKDEALRQYLLFVRSLLALFAISCTDAVNRRVICPNQLMSSPTRTARMLLFYPSRSVTWPRSFLHRPKTFHISAM